MLKNTSICFSSKIGVNYFFCCSTENKSVLIVEIISWYVLKSVLSAMRQVSLVKLFLSLLEIQEYDLKVE